MSDRSAPAFDGDALVRRVTEETFVRTAEVHDELASTNDRALALAGDLKVERPALVLARRQTAGRGRGGNRWWSADGALTFSLLLSLDRHRLPVTRWPEISLTVGVSVCEALRDFAPAADVRLKWPNDVFLDGRKVCGILVEIPSTARADAIVGIGVNVNNRVAAAPEPLRLRAASLADVAGRSCPPQDVLVAVLQSFEIQLDRLCGAAGSVRSLWRRYDLLFGRTVRVGDGQEIVGGLCEGIDDDGALLVRTTAGIRRLYGGVVQHFD